MDPRLRKLRLHLLALVVLLIASGASLAAAESRSAPALMAQRLLAAQQPWRDPLDLAVRFRGVPATTPLVATSPPAPLLAGAVQTFSVLDQRSTQLFGAQATLRLVTEHAHWFVESALADSAPQADLERSASVFENKTYPLIHQYFGAEPSPTVDGTGHIVFLLGNVPGVAAYFSNTDAYPTAINPSSNVHDMIYVNLNALRPGQADFDATITHEFQHMVHFARCPAQESWVDEGTSELAMRVAGYQGAQPLAFAGRPDVQLNAWSVQSSDLIRHYQAAYLFLRYVAERAGGWSALPALLETCARGEGLFSAFLARQPIAPDLDSLFTDWSVANLLQEASVANGKFAYANGGFHATVTGSLSAQAPFLGDVPQYAANYVDLPPAAGVVTFNGDASVPLFAAPDSGGAWWSNRGDSMDSRLTRSVDLRGLADATLRFRAWYDLEDQYDYVYLSASADAGQTWRVLSGQHTTPDRATGNNFGVGWTASSGGWTDEEVDLSALCGSEIVLRFDYVTDQSFNGQGFAIKDVAIPQLGLDEPGAADGAWAPEGWVRVDAPVPEHWNLRLVQWTTGGISVTPVPVTTDGTATIPLDPAAARASLVIAPTAPRTLLRGSYSVAVGP